MSQSHPEYSEYATCTVCGMHKYCKPFARYFMCYSCACNNFKGLKNINTKTKDKQL